MNGKVAVVSLTMVSKDPQEITKASEVMARAGAGLTLDGITVNLNFGWTDDQEGEE